MCELDQKKEKEFGYDERKQLGENSFIDLKKQISKSEQY